MKTLIINPPCEFGFARGSDGCETCACNPPPVHTCLLSDGTGDAACACTPDESGASCRSDDPSAAIVTACVSDAAE